MSDRTPESAPAEPRCGECRGPVIDVPYVGTHHARSCSLYADHDPYRMRTPARVRVLLDVDGVLNAVTRDPDPAQFDDWVDGRANEFGICWSPTVARTVRSWAETPGVEVLWLTTWEDMANEHLCALLDLPEMVVAGRQDFEAQASGLLVAKDDWWKLDVAQALYELDSLPFVWLDDDLVSERPAHLWLASLDVVEPRPYLAIGPPPYHGLTQTHLDLVGAFIAERVMDTEGAQS